ncbi:hypothetical protein NHJ13051_001564 [Beauveria bassiana]
MQGLVLEECGLDPRHRKGYIARFVYNKQSQEEFIELPHLWNLETEAVQALFTSQLKTAKLNADHQKTYQVISLPQSAPQARNEIQVFRISVCTYIGTLLHNVASIKHAKKAPEIYPPTHWFLGT